MSKIGFQSVSIEAVIFDLDGVIIDSNPEIEIFWHQWANKSGVALSPDLIKQHIHGRRGVETIAALFPHLPEETKDLIIREAIEFDTEMKPSIIGGVSQFIQRLSEEPFKIALVTSSHRKRALKMLANHKLDSFFATLVTAEDVSKGKPDPAPYLAASQKLNLPVDKCLVFEDAVSGVISAKAAGMHVIGIGKSGEDVLSGAGAETVIDDFSEIFSENGSILIGEKSYCFSLL